MVQANWCGMANDEARYAWLRPNHTDHETSPRPENVNIAGL